MAEGLVQVYNQVHREMLTPVPSVKMNDKVSENNSSFENEAIKIATIAALTKAIKDNARTRQFRTTGRSSNT